eukprot:6206266-Pleurochrysis_carterae.AAC.3
MLNHALKSATESRQPCEQPVVVRAARVILEDELEASLSLLVKISQHGQFFSTCSSLAAGCAYLSVKLSCRLSRTKLANRQSYSTSATVAYHHIISNNVRLCSHNLQACERPEGPPTGSDLHAGMSAGHFVIT